MQRYCTTRICLIRYRGALDWIKSSNIAWLVGTEASIICCQERQGEDIVEQLEKGQQIPGIEDIVFIAMLHLRTKKIEITTDSNIAKTLDLFSNALRLPQNNYFRLRWGRFSLYYRNQFIGQLENFLN